jgi:hypothetical protein
MTVTLAQDNTSEDRNFSICRNLRNSARYIPESRSHAVSNSSPTFLLFLQLVILMTCHLQTASRSVSSYGPTELLLTVEEISLSVITISSRDIRDGST